MFHHRRNHCFQGCGCQASSRDLLGSELIACVATSCSKQPHAEGQKVRRADGQADRPVKTQVSREARCCHECVTDMLNPSRNTWDAAAEMGLLYKETDFQLPLVQRDTLNDLLISNYNFALHIQKTKGCFILLHFVK